MSISRRCCANLLLLHHVLILSIAAGISVRVGDLAQVNTADAIGFMSGITMDTDKWLQLGHSSVHPEALLRFMVLGAPSEGVLPSLSWGHREQEEMQKLGGLLATRDASIAESTLHQEVQDKGSLHINAWMLGFQCVGSQSRCQTLAPAALLNRTDQASGSACLEFTTVWDKLLPGTNSTLVSNTLTAKLISAIKQKSIVAQGEGSLDMFSFNVLSEAGMETCPSTSMQVAVRSTLDATYNLGPYACYHFNFTFARVAGSEYLLVLGMRNPTNTPSAFIVEGIGGPANKRSYRQKKRPGMAHSSLQHPNTKGDLSGCIKWWLQNVENVELGKCKHSPRLIFLGKTDAAACRIDRNGGSSACLKLNLNSIIKDHSECNSTMLSYFNSSFIPDTEDETEWWDESGIQYIRGSSSYGLPTDNLCEDGGSFLKSTLTPSTGADYSDQERTYINNPLAVDAEALGLVFTELNNKYAQAHSDAFQLANGSPLDFPTTVVAFVGAAIAVLAATVPFADLLLRGIVICSGTLGGSALKRYIKMVVLIGINILLAQLCFGAIQGTIESERQRSKKFKTWAVITDTLVVNPMGLQLMALYVVHAESTYKSRLLVFIYLLAAAVVVFVIGVTLHRYCDALKKLKLIKTKEKIPELVKNVDIPHALKHKLESFTAIDMNDSDYRILSYLHVHQSPIATTFSDDQESVLRTRNTIHNVVDDDNLHSVPDANSTLQHLQVHLTLATFKQVSMVALSVQKFKRVIYIAAQGQMGKVQ